MRSGYNIIINITTFLWPAIMIFCSSRYQQEGTNWLAFLKRFNLHKILCNDMGLGKILQASATVASDIADHCASNGNANP